MVVSMRSALLICAALGLGSVTPAQAGPADLPLLPVQTSVSSSTIVQNLLRSADQVAETTATTDTSDTTATTDNGLANAIDRNADLPTMVAELRGDDPGSHELECLAAGIYFESKGEPLDGQLAVGQVIANRADSHRFPDSYCGVVLQRGQFSFVRHGAWPHIRRDSRSWKTAVAIARIVDRDLKDSSAEDALYFHARRVKPGWHKTRVASIGNHIFFR